MNEKVDTNDHTERAKKYLAQVKQRTLQMYRDQRLHFGFDFGIHCKRAE